MRAVAGAPLLTAHAHGVAGGDGDVQLAQTVAGTELTMVIRRTTAATIWN